MIYIVSITTSGKPLNNPHGGPDSIVTTQGDGDGDFVIVDTAQVWGNISETQGNGNGDWPRSPATRLAGRFRLVRPSPISSAPRRSSRATATTIPRRSIAARLRTSLINYANNVFVSQGASLAFVGCTPGLGDVINVNCSIIVSDMTLEQGEGDTTSGLGLGNNFISVATDSAVVVGDSTVINEIGPNNGNNTILLGGASGGPDSGDVDFETGFLDVYTGAAGGAFVQVYNTLVDYGAHRPLRAVQHQRRRRRQYSRYRQLQQLHRHLRILTATHSPPSSDEGFLVWRTGRAQPGLFAFFRNHHGPLDLVASDRLPASPRNARGRARLIHRPAAVECQERAWTA